MSEAFDIITLRGLSARGHHGVYSFEREGTQPFSVDLSLWVDTTRAAATDDLDLTVDYGQIAEETVAVLEGPSVYLLETLAQRVADAALAHPRVQGVEVTLHKPMAPLRQQFSDVALTIRRGAAALPSSPLAAAAPSSQSSPASPPMDEGGAVGEPIGQRTSARPPASEASPAPVGRRSARPRGEEQAGAERRAVLALGGNLGDAPTTLARAVGALVDVDGLEIDEVSPLVRTTAVLEPGQEPQPDYWNAVVLARTRLEPHDLLAATMRIEADLGRERHEHWGARTVDIDLIQVQGATADDRTLTLPHPRARSRAFVLVPWQLADPDAVLEGAGRVDVLARVAADREGVLDAVSDWLEEPESVAAESDHVLQGRSVHPVLATPAGGSVVVSAVPPARASGTSRLQRLPEASQEDLRPDGSGADYLWRKLWDQWSAQGAAADAPAVPPTRADAQPSAGAVAAPPGAALDGPGAPAGGTRASAAAAPTRERESRGSTEQASRAFATEPTGAPPHDDPAQASRASATEQSSGRSAGSSAPEPESRESGGPSTAPRGATAGGHAEDRPGQPAGLPGVWPAGAPAPARSGEETPPQRRRAPKWVPVRAGAARAASTAASPSASPSSASPAEGRTDARREDALPPSLPAWRFPSGQSVRIVDDPQDLAVSESSAPTPDGRTAGGADTAPAPQRRSILDPQLPPSTPTGPLGHDAPGQTTSIMRRVTVRPTVTGQQPVIRRDGGQPQ